MKSSVAAFSYRPWHIQSLTRHEFGRICNQKSSNRPSVSEILCILCINLLSTKIFS